ncbi:probable inactive 2-oxoglutarate-dependent dioxygenase AOP2 [Quercus suber]|uniref:probable inactive 2-oxoglutarate-dependent dioxygenase AOP2 n=1 Tax=Quercus suber TaxID=58331 RepID=UPI0032DFAE63
MQALEDYGCFVVVYDKAPLELRNEVFGALEELFDLPTETKMKNKYDQKPLNCYVGQIPKIPLHESMGIDNATTIEGTQIFTNMLWPNGNNRFWFSHMFQLYSKLNAIKAVLKRVNKEKFGNVRTPEQSLRPKRRYL